MKIQIDTKEKIIRVEEDGTIIQNMIVIPDDRPNWWLSGCATQTPMKDGTASCGSVYNIEVLN